MSKGITYEEYLTKAAEIDQKAMEEAAEAGADLQKTSAIQTRAALEKQKLSRDIVAQPTWAKDAGIAGAETQEQLTELMRERGAVQDTYGQVPDPLEVAANQKAEALGWDNSRLDVDENGNPRTQEAIAADVKALTRAARSEEERIDVLRRAGLVQKLY